MENVNEKFVAGLEKIRSTAAKNDGSVEVKDILAAFPGIELSEEQIKVIYAYLDREGITLKDYVPHDTSSMSLAEAEAEALLSDEEALEEDERKVYEFYLEELEAVKPLSTKEEEGLKEKLLSGSAAEKKAAADRLTEGNLRFVVQLAKSCAGKGVPLSDLIQEGNIALMMALQEYSGDGEMVIFLEKKIKEAMKAVLREQAGYEKTEENLVNAANRILEVTKEMEEEEGRAVTPAELSARLGIPASKVEEVLLESAKAIKNAEK